MDQAQGGLDRRAVLEEARHPLGPAFALGRVVQRVGTRGPDQGGPAEAERRGEGCQHEGHREGDHGHGKGLPSDVRISSSRASIRFADSSSWWS